MRAIICLLFLVILVILHQLVAKLLNADIFEMEDCHVGIAVHTFVTHKSDVCHLDQMSEMADKLPQITPELESMLHATTIQMIPAETIAAFLPDAEQDKAATIIAILQDCANVLPNMIAMYKALTLDNEHDCAADFPNLTESEEDNIAHCFTEIINSGLETERAKKMIHIAQLAAADAKPYLVEFEFLQSAMHNIMDIACDHKTATYFVVNKIIDAIIH